MIEHIYHVGSITSQETLCKAGHPVQLTDIAYVEALRVERKFINIICDVCRFKFFDRFNTKDLSDEDLAFELLVRVITLGRNNMPYKAVLNKLKKALKNAPGVSKAINNSMKGLL